jgi:hypothetical protein
MNDPHVASLRYRLITDGTLRFVNPPALIVKGNGFEADLRDGVLTVKMLAHYLSEPEARQVVGQFLRGWEVESFLKSGLRIRFEFEKSEVIDRRPGPSGSAALKGVASGTAVASLKPEVHLERHSYPAPPNTSIFLVTPDVETLLNRFQGYQQDREPLSAMAYFCLTVLQAPFGSRTKAATILQTDRDVLDTLGKLTSTTGGETARKATRNPPMTSKEKTWVEAAVKALIRRLAEHAAHSGTGWSSNLTMKDLPPV